MTGSIPFDRVAGTYDQTRGGLDRGRRLAAILAELLPERGRLLEVGVGTGAVAAGEPGRPVTPRSEADLIEARSHAWTWSIDDQTWARVVEPTLERVRALPDQDRVRPGPGPTILAFRHP